MKINKTNLLLIVIFFTASALRLYNITAISLWHDEAFSALLIRYPFSEMINRIILDVHPPLYYILLRVWDIILGDSLYSLRLFSAFFGILTVLFIYLFVNKTFKNEKFALISAAFIAINPFQIQYAAEARMYTLGTFLIIFSSWLLVKALKSQESDMNESLKNACANSLKKCDWLSSLTDFESNPKNAFSFALIKIKKYRWWIFYGIGAALTVYTHYYLIFSVAAQALFVIFLAFKNNGIKIGEWLKNENIIGAAIAYIISFLSFLPWLPILLKQLSQVEENYWIPSMDRYSMPNTIFHLFTGTNIYTTNLNLIIVSLVFIMILAFAMKQEKNTYKWLVLFSFFIPFIISIILSFKRSLYLDRYFVFVGLFYFIILAIFIESIKKKAFQYALFIALAIASILLFAEGWQNVSPNGKPGMAGASKYLFENVKPEEKVYVNSSFIFFTYKYYAYQNYFNGGFPLSFNPSKMNPADNVFAGRQLYPEYLTPLLYTPGLSALSDIPHFSGTALLTDFDLLTDFNKNLKQGETVWLVWTTGFGSGKPDIPKNWTQTEEKGFLDVFDYRGWIVVTKYRVQ